MARWNMRFADDIRRLFKNARLSIHPDTDERVFEDMLRAMQKTKENSPAMPDNKWRVIMKSPLTKFAVAAVVVFACVIGISLWRATGSGIALADVLARVEQAKSFTCKGTFAMTSSTVTGKPYQWEVYYTYLESQEYGTKVRREVQDPNGGKRLFGESYFSPQKKMITEIDHAQKEYTRTELDDAGVRQAQKISHRFGDPRAFLYEIVTSKHESLGQSTVNGVEVEGFRSTDPNCRGSGFGFKNPQVDVKLWVDVKARLPVRYESLKTGLDEMGNKMSHHWVMQDFQWDIPVDASEFEPPAAPSDYIVLVEKPLGPVNEETAIQALRQCVELLGKYPESLSVALPRGLQLELERSSNPAATRLKEALKGLTEQEKMNRLMDAGTPMRLLFEFYVMGLVEDNEDPAYYGKTVNPKDSDKILLRWKISDKEYRVIFGDLHTETVSPERLVELEKP
jgi:hypothetical protein